jgi:hypothetical protein
MNRTIPVFFVLSIIFLMGTFPVATAGIPDEIAAGLADALDTDTGSAGFLLGFVVILVCMLIVVLVFGRNTDWHILVLIGLCGMALAIGIGWWPLWTAVLVVIGAAVLLVGMPGVSRE